MINETFPSAYDTILLMAVFNASIYLVLNTHACTHAHTHTHPFNGLFSGTTQVSWYQKGETSLDFTEARDSEWQWHQLGHMQVCTSLQADNHANTPPLSFLQAGCSSCHPTNSVKALKEISCVKIIIIYLSALWKASYEQKHKLSINLLESRL